MISFYKLYNYITLISPKIEIFIRKFYWDHLNLFYPYFRHPTSSVNEGNFSNMDVPFDKILEYIRSLGVAKSDIIIVHSSYASLKQCGIAPEKVINGLYSLVDEGGTLAMPAIRKFKEEGEGYTFLNNYIRDDVPDITLYDVNKTPIVSGILPFILSRFEGAVISKFPLNPLVAIGSQAEKMMEKNTLGDFPSAHGENSCWAFCAKANAWNIGIGISLKDFLTIFHVGQENMGWPVKGWYFKRKFTIRNGEISRELCISERRRIWTKYFAENNFYNDLIKNKILRVNNIKGISILSVRSNDLFEFMSKSKNPTYPYYIPSKYKK